MIEIELSAIDNEGKFKGKYNGPEFGELERACLNGNALCMNFSTLGKKMAILKRVERIYTIYSPSVGIVSASLYVEGWVDNGSECEG